MATSTSTSQVGGHANIPPVGDATTTVVRDPANGPAYLRGSPDRAQKLWRYISTIVGTTNLSVVLTEDHETAAVKPHPSGEGWLVLVTATEVPQPATDLDRDDYDYRVQHALGLHETGHILYTDFAALQDRIEQFIADYPAPVTNFAHSLFNAFEDGVIEQCIREDFSNTAAGRLHLTNQNLRLNRLQAVPADQRTTITAPAAVQTAAADLAVADSGITRRLCDPADTDWQFETPVHRRAFLKLLPALQETHLESMAAQSAANRYDTMANCARTVIEALFGNVGQQGSPQSSNSGKPDPTQQGQQSQQTQQSTPGEQTDTDTSGNNAEHGASGSTQLAASPEAATDEAAVGSPHPMPTDPSARPDTTSDSSSPRSDDADTPSLSPADVDELVDTKSLDQTPDYIRNDQDSVQLSPSETRAPTTDSDDTAGGAESGSSGPEPPDNSADSTSAGSLPERDTTSAPDSKKESNKQGKSSNERDDSDENPDTKEQSTLGAFAGDSDTPTSTSTEQASDSQGRSGASSASGASEPSTGASESDTETGEERPPTGSENDERTASSETGNTGSDLPDSATSNQSHRPGPIHSPESPNRDDGDAGVDEIPGIDASPPGRLQTERNKAQQQAREQAAAQETVETALDDLPDNVEVLPSMDRSTGADGAMQSRLPTRSQSASVSDSSKTGTEIREPELSPVPGPTVDSSTTPLLVTRGYYSSALAGTKSVTSSY